MDVEIQNSAGNLPALWLEQITHTGAEVGSHHVDLLLDQTGWSASVIPTLQRIYPSVPWFSLFSGTPEEPLLEQGPLLMRLDLQQWQHKAWLEDLIEHAGNDSRLLLLVSPQPFEDLSLTLQALSRMSVGGQPGLLRYYDPRVFPWLIADILNPQQRDAFLQVASYWSWLDRDARPQWRQGTCSADPQALDTPEPLELTDAQYEMFGCISDAQRLMTAQVINGLWISREQQFSQLYAWARKAGEEGYFGELEHYVAQQLTSVSGGSHSGRV
ncbi:DUF4123 domain-containing protein [Metapseudomonas resinovorans]|uniref:DUF4123 domain-containing protein n=1 Tax=Metapseudomonas resinovorans NBRC 106553 TaxID=1245471 RepID=S6AKZ8_METRE|nr:DUF4123 domain-containing protein [Pseudomonas resinovorans]BAN45893.1 hypothetical protein PCA10_01610 [Pseudomonas resinovorans NBRC 106553]